MLCVHTHTHTHTVFTHKDTQSIHTHPAFTYPAFTHPVFTPCSNTAFIDTHPECSHTEFTHMAFTHSTHKHSMHTVFRHKASIQTHSTHKQHSHTEHSHRTFTHTQSSHRPCWLLPLLWSLPFVLCLSVFYLLGGAVPREGAPVRQWGGQWACPLTLPPCIALGGVLQTRVQSGEMGIEEGDRCFSSRNSPSTCNLGQTVEPAGEVPAENALSSGG